MDYIYAVLLLHNAKKEISEKNIKDVLSSVGISVDEGKLKGLLTSLKDINISEALEKATLPVAAASEATQAPVKEEKKEEEVEVSEESAAEGLGSLFG